jgi:hypothetical protein
MVDGAVAVWTGDAGVPVRLLWNGLRFRVTDTPTRLEPDFALMTHPAILDGWRFQGTSEDGETHVFDVIFSESRREWRLIRVYE